MKKEIVFDLGNIAGRTSHFYTDGDNGNCRSIQVINDAQRKVLVIDNDGNGLYYTGFPFILKEYGK